MDDELAQFKILINLTEYAAGVYGYVRDARASSAGCAMMRDGAGSKLAIVKDLDGHWIYCSIHDDADNGSIIDLVQHREGCTLGRVRQLLRPWIGRSPVDVPSANFARSLKTSQPDRPAVSLAFSVTLPLDNGRHRYLQSRGILPATLAEPRFAGAVRSDARDNAIFPHFDSAGLCGYEIKNRGFTGFAVGGIKGLWFSRNAKRCQRLYIVEAAIDALSHGQLYPDAAAGYLSVGGQFNDSQPTLLARAIEKARARGATVIIATDADEGGDALADALNALSPVALERVVPAANDWNDLLAAPRQGSAE